MPEPPRCNAEDRALEDDLVLDDTDLEQAQRLLAALATQGPIPPGRPGNRRTAARAGGLSTVEIARRLGISHQAVSAIERRALAKCRRWCERQGLDPADMLTRGR